MAAEAILAFGYGKKMSKKLRLNIQSMSKVDSVAVQQYFAPKVSMDNFVFVDKWGCTDGVEARIGDMDSMFWRAFYAATLSPSYLNRQPYAFILKDHDIILIRKPDSYTDDASAKLNLGIVLLHFTSVASQLLGNLKWKLGGSYEDLGLPEGCTVAAHCSIA